MNRLPGSRRHWALVVLQFVCLALAGYCGVDVFSRAASALALVFYSALFAIDHIFFRVMRQPLGFDMIALGFRERRYVRSYAGAFVGRGDFIFASLLVTAALMPALFPPSANGFATAAGVAGLVMLAFPWVAAPSPSGIVRPFYQLLRTEMRARRNKARIAEPVRRRIPFPVRHGSGSPRWNVLTIVNESLSRSLLDGPGAEATPILQSFLRANAGNVFRFPLALSNTTASDISYPSLFTGLSPAQPRERFETNPLAWSAAKAAGYHTSFYVAWDMKWAGLRDLVVDDQVDLIVDPVMLSETIVNDTGIDDLVLSRHASRWLEHAPTPFYSVAAFNGQHIPCLVDESVRRYDLNTFLGRYLNSLTVLDSCFGELMDSLRKSGKLETTIIFFLSDHGENPGHFDRPGADASGFSQRVDEFTHDLLSVPFWIYLPDAAMKSPGVAALRENQSNVVSNLDYYPSVISAMGMGLNGADHESLRLAGHDLFKPLPVGREIPCWNTGALRKWSVAPAALASGRQLLIYHDLTKSYELVDLDQEGRGNLWPSTPETQKEWWIDRMAANGLCPAMGAGA